MNELIHFQLWNKWNWVQQNYKIWTYLYNMLVKESEEWKEMFTSANTCLSFYSLRATDKRWHSGRNRQIHIVDSFFFFTLSLSLSRLTTSHTHTHTPILLHIIPPPFPSVSMSPFVSLLNISSFICLRISAIEIVAILGLLSFLSRSLAHSRSTWIGFSLIDKWAYYAQLNQFISGNGSFLPVPT